MKFKYLIKSLIVNIYLNNYILSKAKLYFCFYMCLWYCYKEAISSTSSDTLRERLYLNLNVINYFTCKTILVLFSNNFILALFATFCGGKKLTKKMTNLKIFSIN